ncbi:putative glutamine-tRNA ligase [Smittium mucronatum]|uniref:glutamine--tRNA ligase n=1 Tax=Smittium mucronatum TaxID=133383 RepID=A0A1R0GYL7_9FUNG|nr:putative glutamine-tRNA ligase [Smittium mucronatum]
MSDFDSLVSAFKRLGLSDDKAAETAKNSKISPVLYDAFCIAQGDSSEISKSTGSLLYNLSTTITPEAKVHFNFLCGEIIKGNLSSSDQISGISLQAIKYCKKAAPEETYPDFKIFCGIGVFIDDSTISTKISGFLKENKEKLESDRYKVLGLFLSKIRQDPELRWAKAEKIKTSLESQVLELLGPKDERDIPVKGKAKKTPKTSTSVDSNVPIPKPKQHQKYTPASFESMFSEGDISRLHKSGENPQISPEILKKHLEFTKGKVITRFPPEPNGFLHIGHAKAINVNFGYAEYHNGKCNLRYDDTNPETEEVQYLDSILEAVRWLGFTPDKILYASDYFDQLYNLAIILIEKGLAYVCHCTAEKMFEDRGGDSNGPRVACEHRDRSVESSLLEFQKMKDGRYKSGEAILRMKMDLEDGNPQMWDLVAYRIIYSTHHRTGDKWCIYPTYDFAHCLCDSIENITHSLCTTEFVQSRKSYYWLCDAVEVYKPVQWEYGRLSVTNTILSKRKLLKLLENNIISSLDDPRLYTLPALRRRGVPALAINGFVRELGVTTSKTTIEVSRLENHIRDCLNSVAPRLMAVLDPIKVKLINLGKSVDLEVPFNPRDPSFGSHSVPFTDTLFIDSSDFRLEDSKDYYRLAPGKTVGLLYAPGPITCTEVIYGEDGGVLELLCKLEDGADGKPIPKPKTYIQWVPFSPKHGSPVVLDEIRLYNDLFKHSNPYDKTIVPGGFLTDINPESLVTIKSAIVETGFYDLLFKFINGEATRKEFDSKNFEELRFQFLRTGYFTVDKDTHFDSSFIETCRSVQKCGDPVLAAASNKNKLVLNRIVTLKGDPNK